MENYIIYTPFGSVTRFAQDSKKSLSSKCID